MAVGTSEIPEKEEPRCGESLVPQNAPSVPSAQERRKKMHPAKVQQVGRLL